VGPASTDISECDLCKTAIAKYNFNQTPAWWVEKTVGSNGHFGCRIEQSGERLVSKYMNVALKV
jgi:ribosomal protein L37AE/L43A